MYFRREILLRDLSASDTTRNMKTVFICHNYSDNSFASASKFLADYLSEKGYNVVFLSHKPRGLKAFKEGNLTVLPWPVQGRPISIKAAFFFIKTFLQYRPKYIIGHFGGAVLSSILSTILSFGSVKVFNVYHTLTWQNKIDFDDGGLRFKLQTARRSWFYRLFISEIIAPSNAAKKDYLENWPHKKVNVVYNGYKTRDIAKDIKSVYGRKELIFLGRLDVSKGVVQLIEAFDRYTKNNPESDLKLTLIGQAQDGVSLDTNNNDRIRLAGVVTYDKVPKIISEAYFMVTPSLMDNLPTVGIEALSYSTPIVASNKGGWPEIVDDKSGYVIEPTVEDLVATFDKLDKLTLTEYETYCNNARKKYESRFVLEHYASGVEKLLTK